MKKIRRKRKGFTLVEIMIGVTIVVLISVVVLPSLGGGREKARNVKRNSIIEQYVAAFELYKGFHDSYPSPSSQGPTITKCLGARNGDPCGRLVYSGSTLSPSSQTGEQNAQLDAEIATVYPNAPFFEKIFYFSPVQGMSMYHSGPTYNCTVNTVVNNRCYGIDLVWALEGINQKCALGAISYNQGQATECNLSI